MRSRKGFRRFGHFSAFFFLNARLESFLRGHLAAFEAWNGCTSVVLYDNLRSAVLERQGDAIRFHSTLLEFAAHYHYEPRPVAVARGQRKGTRRARHPVRPRQLLCGSSVC
jgi:hypothetical protein